MKGTRTEKNLLKAFSGESQARNRYTMYASKARKEGYEKISEVFLITAMNEYEHASLFYKKLTGGPLEITETFPAGDIGTTLENLKYAAEGEGHEAESLYPEYARIAKEEGFDDIAELFTNIASIEKHHQERYNILYNLVKSGFFIRDTEQVWECRECGYLVTGKEAPEVCPTCDHPQSFYQIKVDIF